MSEKPTDQRSFEHRILSDDDIAFGFGRVATDAELEEYFLRTESDERIDIENVISRYNT